MKILYVANERRAAELAGFALRTVAPDVTVVWAASLGDARGWVDENRNVATIIVEVDSDNPRCASFVIQVRGLGVLSPVIVVPVHDPAPPLTALKMVANEIIAKDSSFLNRLSEIVRRALHTPRATAQPARGPVRLLYVGDAALARESLLPPGRSIEVVEAIPEPGRKFDPLARFPFDILLIEHGYPNVETFAILRDVAARKLHVPAVIVAEWDEQLAVLALKLGALDYVAKSNASFRALSFRLNRLIEHSSLLKEQSELRDSHAASPSSWKADLQRNLELPGPLALEPQLSAARAHIDRLQHELEATRRASEATRTQPAETVETSGRARLEHELRAAMNAAAKAEHRLGVATERLRLREASLHATTDHLDRERARGKDLERRLVDAEATLRETTERHQAELEAAEARLAERQSASGAQLAQSAAAEHLVQRESELAAGLAEAIATKQTLEQQLADRDEALRLADERAAIARTVVSADFARRQSELEAALTREATQRLAIEQKLAQAVQVPEALEQRLNDALATIEQDRQDRAADAAAAAAHLAQREAELLAQRTPIEATLARELTNRQSLEQQVADARLALLRAEERQTSEIKSAATRFTEQQRQADARLAQAAAAHDALQAKLVDGATALQRAEQQAAADRQAAAQEAAQRQAKFDAALLQEAARRRTLEQRLAAAEAAHQRAEEQHASEIAAAAARLTESRTQADARLFEAAAALAAREAQLTDTTAQLNRAEQQASAERQAALEQAAERQTTFDTARAQEAARRQTLEQRLAAAEAAHQRAEEQHASEIAAAAARLSEATDAIAALQGRLADTTAELNRAEQQAFAERQAALEQAAERQTTFDTARAQEAARRQTLEQRLAAAEAAHQRADEEHASEITAALQRAEQRAVADRQAAEEEIAQGQAEFETALAHERASREALEKQVADLEAARRRTGREHASELAAAAARLAEYQKDVEAQTAHAAAEAARQLQATEQRAAAERQALAERAADRHATYENEISHEINRRQAVEEELGQARAASEQAERRFVDEVAAMRQRAHEHEARLEERAACERAEWERTLVEREERIAQLEAESDVARQSLLAAQSEIQRQDRSQEEERATFERDRTASETDLAQQRAAYNTLQQAFEQTRTTARQALERVSSERASDRARLEALVAERDTQLQEQAARKQAADEAAANALVNVERRLQQTLEARSRDSHAIDQLKEQLDALARELAETRKQREVLTAEAGHVPELRKQLADVHAEVRRRFDHSPIALCRCTRNGVMTQVNRALASLLGYKTAQELAKVDFAAVVVEAPDELQWLIDGCVASRSTESVETTWRRKDGRRIIVRVLAVATTPESIDLAVEDLTAVRALEEKLRNAQRMEAVGRYASEVAVTCDNLLKNVEQEGQQWLARMESETARHRGVQLLDEVSRATRFLQQLAVYGHEQRNAPELVDVNQVLRDLQSVLKRVAGDNIELVLPKASAPIHAEVEAERLERILVNVAAYGRERMPFGGRLMVEVATVIVDRKFVAKYPNVRPGHHVLLTVTEARGAARADWSATVRNQTSDAIVGPSAADKPGVDLGTLQGLVGASGGHLWMMAEPPGDMVLKIHLPRRVLDDRAPAKRPGRARWLNRLSRAAH